MNRRKIQPLVQLISLGAVSLLLASCSISGSSGSVRESVNDPDLPYTYMIPKGFERGTDIEFASTVGSNSSNGSAISLNGSVYDNIIVATFPLPVSFNRETEDAFKAEFMFVMQQAASNVNAFSAGYLRKTSIAGLPGFRFSLRNHKAPDYSGRVDSDFYVIFKGHMEYQMSCQWTSGKKKQVLAGCEKVKRSFRVRK